jgi:hypothetical protein
MTGVATESAGRVPRVGDIVHYYRLMDRALDRKAVPQPLPEPRLGAFAAIVTHVYEPDHPRSDVALTVFRPGGSPKGNEHEFLIVKFSEPPADSHWSWRPT